MPRYAPELVASVIDQYLHTDKPVELIAREHEMNERDVTRIRHAAGVPPRGARVRSLPPAMTALVEARALLRAPADDGGRNKQGEAERIAPDDAGGAMRCAYCALRASLVVGGESAIDRIERLVEQELAAEEAGRAKFGQLPRAQAMRSAARARSPFSPKPFRRWPACAAARRPKDTAMTTTCPPTSMSSVTNLRAAYALLCKAGMEQTYAAQVKARTALRSKP